MQDALTLERRHLIVRKREHWAGHAPISADRPRCRRYISAAQRHTGRLTSASRQRVTAGAAAGPGPIGNSGGVPLARGARRRSGRRR